MPRLDVRRGESWQDHGSPATRMAIPTTKMRMFVHAGWNAQPPKKCKPPKNAAEKVPAAPGGGQQAAGEVA